MAHQNRRTPCASSGFCRQFGFHIHSFYLQKINKDPCAFRPHESLLFNIGYLQNRIPNMAATQITFGTLHLRRTSRYTPNIPIRIPLIWTEPPTM